MTSPNTNIDELNKILEIVWMAALDAKAMIDEEGMSETDYLNKQTYHFKKANK